MQELASMATSIDPSTASKGRASIPSSRPSLQKRPDSSHTLTTNSASDDSDNNVNGVSKKTSSRRTYQRAYLPQSKTKSLEKKQGSGPLDYSSRSGPPLYRNLPRSKTPLEGLSTHSERMVSSRSSTPNTDDSDVEHVIGTFSVPTFKEEELSTSHDASRTSRRRGNTHSNRGTDPPGERGHGNIVASAAAVVDRIPERRRSSDLTMEFMESERALSDDDWMGDALLHGLSGANDNYESVSQILSVSLGQRVNGYMADEKRDSSSHSDEVLPSFKATRRRSSRTYVLDSSSHSDEVPPLGQTTSHRSSQSNSASRASRRSSRRRSSKSSSISSKELGQDFFLSHMESKLGENHLNSNDGLRATFSTRQKVNLSTENKGKSRRSTVAAMNDEDLRAYLLEMSKRSTGRKNNQNFPPDALSNIPALPLVKSFKVIKQSPDEPAGLFLTKAKNGAVLVHSLSSGSLFRGTNLCPGHEVLSVNEKRVNNPKMTASLITQARGQLVLRASEAGRPRGFLYCQVKRKEKAGAVGMGGTAHGLRFVTTNVDGVKRGNPNSDGLVRVSAVDPNGLFSKSHPLNRLRVGSIILTVNGTPTTSGREALEHIMSSKHLVEVLHCDERVWREDWLWSGLEEAEGGEKKSPQEMMKLVFGKDRFAVSSEWSREWNEEQDDVILRKKGANWAFRLIFNGGVGTCCPEEVNDPKIMMPPTDEFDVSLFAKLVNEKQRTIMQVLRNMLGRAKFELRIESRSFKDVEKASAAVVAGRALLGGDFDKRKSRKADALARNSMNLVKSLGVLQAASQAPEAKPSALYNRKLSCDPLGLLMAAEEESVDEEIADLAFDLLRDDDHDRHRQRRPQDTADRRASIGFIDPSSLDAFDGKELEAWYLANNALSNDDKLQWIHSRRKRMDDQLNNKHLESSIRSGYTSASAHSMFSVDSMLDADDIEDYLDGTSSASDGQHSYATIEVQSPPQTEPKSPRLDERSDEQTISPKTKVTSNSTQSEEKEANEQSAYITGVFRCLDTKYEVSDIVIGTGGFGEVRECYDKKYGRKYVVKTIVKPPIDDTSKINLIRNEILLLHEAKHPNIVELKDLFEDKKSVQIVMEQCIGGDLFDVVVNENPQRIRRRAEFVKHESQTATTMKSIMQVIKYLHSKNIVHRDIKPEHFLLSTDKKDTQRIKLIDFGLARKHVKGSPLMTTFTGSPSFVAPEVIAQKYDHMCDLFSTGVTAYFLLTGMLPFDGATDEDTFQLISLGEFQFPSSSIHLSDDARDFVTKLLKTNPSKRMTAEEALDHPWLKKDATC